MVTKLLYVVRMERWGDPEKHSYNIGIYDCPNAAKKAGEENKEYRGGKYEPVVESWVLNNVDYTHHSFTPVKIGRLEVRYYFFKHKADRYFGGQFYKIRKEYGFLCGLHWLSMYITWSRKSG